MIIHTAVFDSRMGTGSFCRGLASLLRPFSSQKPVLQKSLY